MPLNVLITGSAPILGSHLAALYLTSGTNVSYLAQTGETLSGDDFTQLVRQNMRRVTGERDPPDRDLRLRWLRGTPPPDAQATKIWYLSAGACHARSLVSPANARRVVLDALPRFRATEFNYVSPAHTGCANSCETDGTAIRCAAEREVRERCNALGIGYRIFRTPLLIGEDISTAGARGEGLLHFLSVLHGIKGEIEERLPEYFDYQALRCLAPETAVMNLIRIEEAAQWMLHIAQSEDTLNDCHDIVGPDNVLFTDLRERVGVAYDLSLLAVAQSQELNAVDQLFEERLDGFQFLLKSPVESADEAAPRPAKFAPQLTPLGPDEQTALFRAVRRSQDAARAGRAARIAALSGALEQKTIDRDGSSLTYYAGGSGSPPVVLLNALGQGLHYWLRLIDQLMRYHRVITWEPRGLESTFRSFRLEDHVDDLEAVLAAEGVGSCNLIGWCTGPKVALEFYRRRPETVGSMVFLNCSFKCPNSPADLDTAYERNLEPLFRLVDRRPDMAASVRTTLIALASGDRLNALESGNGEEFGTSVLSMMNIDLREHVQAPFRSEPVLVNYTRQLIDFWSYDAATNAQQVRAPVLLICSEHDQIASPEMSRFAARQIPSARLVQVQGATHYCLYDRPDLIAQLIEVFFENPDGLEDTGGEVKSLSPLPATSGSAVWPLESPTAVFRTAEN